MNKKEIMAEALKHFMETVGKELGDIEGVETIYDTEEDCFLRAKDYARLQPGDIVRMHMQGRPPRKAVFIKWVQGIPEQPAHVTVMCWNEEDKTMNPITCPVWFLEVLS